MGSQEKNTINILKSRILWKVYLNWFFKRILPLVVLEVLFLGTAAYLLAKYIFVGQIVNNTLLVIANNPLSAIYFLAWAFIKTHLLNKLIIIFLLSLGALFLRDFGRAVASYYSTARMAKPNR